MPRRGQFSRPRESHDLAQQGDPGDAERRPSTVRQVGRKVSLGLGCALFAAGAVSVILNAFPATQLANRFTVMAAAFVPYGLLAFGGAAILLAAATSSRRWARPLALVAVAGMVLQAWWARPYLPSSPSEHGTVGLLTMNLRCDAGGMGDLGALVENLQPDVVVVQGISWRHHDRLGDGWSQLLPYSTFHPMAHLPTCGTAVFSRTPVTEVPSPSPQPIVEVDGATPFLLLPVDMETPSKSVAPWLEDFQDLTDAVDANPGTPLIAAGDFNAVREHAPMRTLLNDTGLRDAVELAGAGWTPTFAPAPWLPPLIGLDHVLVSPNMVASDFHTYPIKGQDHRAVSVRIGFGNAG